MPKVDLERRCEGTHEPTRAVVGACWVASAPVPDLVAQALAEPGLIDEYEFVLHPRLAGHGPTLFAGLAKPVDLER
jgi:hypothetical protein